MKWNWHNVPIPEAHVIGLVIGFAMQFFLPFSKFQFGWVGDAAGWLLLLGGFFLCIWSVSEAKEMRIESPKVLLTSGPFALSRNPMYVGWTIIFLGVSLIAGSLWLILILPVVFLYVHFVDIPKEERLLEARFGEEYCQYMQRVRRYF